MPVSVHEITMAAPDIVCVEVRDPPITKGPLVPVSPVETGSYSTMIQRTNPVSGNTEWCYPKGANKDHLKFLDIRATEYLDRAAADVAGDYGAIGGRTVTAVYRASIPYDTGTCRGAGGGEARCVSMRHYLWLQLDGNLANGSHTIDFPAGTGLADAAFNFNDKTTRCSAIRATQVGHRPGDITKLGYYGQWIPGAPSEGAIQLSATKFYVIDPDGTIFFIGNVMTRVAPTDVEANANFTGDDTSLHRYLDGLIRRFSTNVAPLTVTAITNANPGLVTYTGTWDPKENEIVGMSGIGGMNIEGNKSFLKATNVDTEAKTFNIDLNTTSLGTYVPDTYLAGYDSLIHKTILGNRTGTYVYGLDYSAWVPPASGTYRLYLPGIGVSDPFVVDEAIHYEIARNALYGVHVQRNGCAIDIPGYTRPINYRDGQGIDANNLVTAWHTLMPAVMSSELDLVSGGLQSFAVDAAPWVTASRVTGEGGAHEDAGDHDSFIAIHTAAFYSLLTFGYEFLPEASRNTDFGIPKSSTMLDPTLYAGTDYLPDAVHEALWFFDAYRRVQRVDGAVPGGMAQSAGNLPSVGSGPSWLPNPLAALFYYAPDHYSNYIYAFGAAKVAIIFEAEGLTTLASTWLQSALDAWDWAEAIYQNASGERDAYYITDINLKANAAWDDTKYGNVMTALDNLCTSVRPAVSAIMFRASGDTDFKALAETISGVQGFQGYGKWEYIYAAGADAGVVTSYTNSLITGVVSSVVDYSQGDIGYRNQGFSGLSVIGQFSEITGLLRSYLLAENADILDVFQAGMAETLGANQSGLCATNGVGARNITRTLHEDKLRSGAETAPPGITHYFRDYPGGLLRFNNFSNDSPSNWVVESPTGDFETDFGTARVYAPHRLCVPYCQFVVESELIIFQMEYTFHQCALPQFLVAIWMHAHDENTAQTRAPARIRLRMNSAAA